MPESTYLTVTVNSNCANKRLSKNKFIYYALIQLGIRNDKTNFCTYHLINLLVLPYAVARESASARMV